MEYPFEHMGSLVFRDPKNVHPGMKIKVEVAMRTNEIFQALCYRSAVDIKLPLVLFFNEPSRKYHVMFSNEFPLQVILIGNNYLVEDIFYVGNKNTPGYQTMVFSGLKMAILAKPGNLEILRSQIKRHETIAKLLCVVTFVVNFSDGGKDMHIKRQIKYIDLDEINHYYIHGVDKLYRMYAGLSTSLISYENHTIELEIKVSTRWKKDPETTVQQMVKSWIDHMYCLNDACFYRVNYIYLEARHDTGGIVKVGDDRESMVSKILQIAESMDNPVEKKRIILTGRIDSRQNQEQ